MRGGGGSPAASGGGSSSSEDDGDAAWKAAIDSIASVGFGVSASNGSAKAASGGSGEANHGVELEEPQEGKQRAPGLKLYQIKVRNMLDDMLEKNLEIIKAPPDPTETKTEPTATGGGIKLFRKAPPGIKMDAIDKLHVQLKRPRIVPGEEVDEKSKKFRHMLQSVVVDGNDILVSAKKASERSLARLEAREAAAKAKAKREEERVKELRKVRGEKWLPSIAKQMKEEKAWEQRQR
ncbi:hypothetical protein EJB05_07671, partial [Eragrostis curvula]